MTTENFKINLNGISLNAGNHIVKVKFIDPVAGTYNFSSNIPMTVISPPDLGIAITDYHIAKDSLDYIYPVISGTLNEDISSIYYTIDGGNHINITPGALIKNGAYTDLSLIKLIKIDPTPGSHDYKLVLTTVSGIAYDLGSINYTTTFVFNGQRFTKATMLTMNTTVYDDPNFFWSSGFHYSYNGFIQINTPSGVWNHYNKFLRINGLNKSTDYYLHLPDNSDYDPFFLSTFKLRRADGNYFQKHDLPTLSSELDAALAQDRAVYLYSTYNWLLCLKEQERNFFVQPVTAPNGTQVWRVNGTFDYVIAAGPANYDLIVELWANKQDTSQITPVTYGIYDSLSAVPPPPEPVEPFKVLPDGFAYKTLTGITNLIANAKSYTGADLGDIFSGRPLILDNVVSESYYYTYWYQAWSNKSLPNIKIYDRDRTLPATLTLTADSVDYVGNSLAAGINDFDKDLDWTGWTTIQSWIDWKTLAFAGGAAWDGGAQIVKPNARIVSYTPTDNYTHYIPNWEYLTATQNAAITITNLPVRGTLQRVTTASCYRNLTLDATEAPCANLIMNYAFITAWARAPFTYPVSKCRLKPVVVIEGNVTSDDITMSFISDQTTAFPATHQADGTDQVIIRVWCKVKCKLLIRWDYSIIGSQIDEFFDVGHNNVEATILEIGYGATETVP